MISDFLALTQAHPLPTFATLGTVLILVSLLFFTRPEKSKFRLKEHDRRRANRTPHQLDTGQESTQEPKRSEPLQLEGIRITGTPYEILGVKRGASKKEILVAYKEKMKQYHPDAVGRPGTREWNEAQEIAQAITQARDALLKARKNES